MKKKINQVLDSDITMLVVALLLIISMLLPASWVMLGGTYFMSAEATCGIIVGLFSVLLLLMAKQF